MQCRDSELSCRGNTLQSLDVTPCLGSRPQTHCREVDQLPGKALEVPLRLQEGSASFWNDPERSEALSLGARRQGKK